MLSFNLVYPHAAVHLQHCRPSWRCCLPYRLAGLGGEEPAAEPGKGSAPGLRVGNTLGLVSESAYCWCFPPAVCKGWSSKSCDCRKFSSSSQISKSQGTLRTSVFSSSSQCSAVLGFCSGWTLTVGLLLSLSHEV